MPWDIGLLPEQRQAACHIGSHACLRAGPGTGKTLTLSRRVVYLITEQNVLPNEILALTFTRAAVHELRQQIQKELEPYDKVLPRVSTLHSFALRQLVRNFDKITADVVFLVGAEDEYIPGNQLGEEKQGDERRLLYVSLTRARYKLFITHCKRRIGQQKYTGRTSGKFKRTLCRFLIDTPVATRSGNDYLDSQGV